MDTEKTKPRRLRRRLLLMLAGSIALASGLSFVFWFYCIRMPGESYRAQVIDPTQPVLQEQEKASDSGEADQEELTQQRLDELKAHVTHLAETIGERNLAKYEKLCEAADYIESELTEYGYTVKRQTYQCRQLDCFNLDVEIKGSAQPEEIVIIGGHYDSVVGTPGANDNGSGTAAMLVLAKHFQDFEPEKTLRFVAWTNEEPPYFQHEGEMGSWVYAERCRKLEENIVAVISLETMGYFSNEEDSQHYPPPLNLAYPSTGNFLGFVSNLNSRPLLTRAIAKFREHAKIPSEGASLPSATTGVGWSDHWSFWQEGYPGIMVTDTAPFRYPHYHEATDTPEQLNYEEFAKAVDGLVFVIEDLVKEEEEEEEK